MEFGEVEVKGKKFEIEVMGNGIFSTIHDGDQVRAATLDELKTKLAGRLSRAKVKLNIPFVRYHVKDRWNAQDGHGLIKGAITGIHASNRNLLVQLEGSKGTEQEGGYRSEIYVDVEVANELRMLGETYEDAKKRYEDFVEAHKFNGMEAVKKALGGQAEELEVK